MNFVYDRRLSNGEPIANGLTFDGPDGPNKYAGGDQPFGWVGSQAFKRSHFPYGCPGGPTFAEPGTPGLWPIEPNFSVGSCFASMFTTMHPLTLESVRRRKTVIFINQDYEGEPIHLFGDIIHRTCQEFGVHPGQIIYSTSNLIQRKTYNEWKSTSTWADDASIDIYSYPLFYRGGCDDVRNSTNQGRLQTQDEAFDNHYRPKAYLCLNRRWKHHRWYAIHELHHRNLLHCGYVSYGHVDVYCQDPVKDTRLRFPRTKIIPDLESKFPLVLDTDQFHKNLAYDFPGNPPSHSHYLYYDTWFSLVNETLTDPKTVFLSEKIFKPIMHHHPFVVIGTSHVIQALRDFGFSVFDSVIDHSYDKIEDEQDRAEAVIDEVERLCKIDWSAAYDKIKDEIIHNFQHLKNPDKINGLTKRYWDWISYHESRCLNG